MEESSIFDLLALFYHFSLNAFLRVYGMALGAVKSCLWENSASLSVMVKKAVSSCKWLKAAPRSKILLKSSERRPAS